MKHLSLLAILCLPLLAPFATAQSPDQKSDAKTKSIKIWLEALGDPSPEKRQEAIWALGPPIKPEALPALVQKLSSLNPLVRASAAEVLGSDPTNGRTAVPALGKLLKDENADVRKKTLDALVMISKSGWVTRSDGKSLIPALEKILKGDDWNCRLVAADLLVSIDPARKPDAIAVYVQALKKKDFEGSFRAAYSLLDFDPTREEAISYMIGQLKLEKYHQSIPQFLQVSGPSARVALPALHACLPASDIFERCNIASAIAAIAPEETETTLPILIAGLKDKTASLEAAMGLASLGVAARSARPALKQALAELGPPTLHVPPARDSSDKQQSLLAQAERTDRELRRVGVLYAIGQAAILRTRTRFLN